MKCYRGRGPNSGGKRIGGKWPVVMAAVKFIREGGCSVYGDDRRNYRCTAELTHSIEYLKVELERIRQLSLSPTDCGFLCLRVKPELRQDLQTMLMADGIMINGNGFSEEFAVSRPMWLTGDQADAVWHDNELRYLWLVYAEHTIGEMLERARS